jgi:hypothetical protein
VPPLLLSSDDLAEWFGARSLSNGSRSTYRTALRAWFDYLMLSDIRVGVIRHA